MDGSPYGFYYSEGNLKDHFILFLEGGGSCFGVNKDSVLSDCLSRSKTDLGSSLNWKTNIGLEGILSDNKVMNPHFYEWTKVVLPYCDGFYH